ncbi:MAG: response regulator [Lentisphaerae bacterium]|nr:response regulator [Lentisphaerota bacterium]
MEDQKRRKILLIDDDTSLLVTLGDFLKFEGYEVMTAESGEQGLKRLEVMTPDLIILDMSMPGMGGIGFLKAVSSEDGKPKYPVLVLTARANMAEFFANVEVDGFVAKPCDPSDLLMEVGRIIFLRSGAEQEGEAAAAAAGAKRKVLLAEDDDDVRAELESAFAGAGYLIESVQDGPEVVEKAVVQCPDVIVIKQVLANMNGDVAADMVRRMPKTRAVPVVLYDASGTGTAPRTGTKAAVTRFVADNAPKALLAAVEAVLE